MSGLRIANLDDYILPAQECVVSLGKHPRPPGRTQDAVPMALDAGSSAKILVELDDADVSASSAMFSAEAAAQLPQASITLADCLACSGCITSAETVLVEAQSVARMQRLLAQGDMRLVVSLAPQAVASLAVHYGFSLAATAEAIATHFKALGAVCVADAAVAAELSLVALEAEFAAHYSAARGAGRPAVLLAGACPGFVCLAEKTAGDALVHLSRVRSPQALMGALLQRQYGEAAAADGMRLLHVAVAMCPDKKLEASRADFASAVPGGLAETEIVLTASEVAAMLGPAGLAGLAPTPLDEPFGAVRVAVSEAACDDGVVAQSHATANAGSDALCEQLFRSAASRFYGDEPGTLEFVTVRNKDLREVCLVRDGTPVLRMATAYGLRNLQTLLRKIKSGSCTYDFVEAMACPGGCLAGGGQIRSADRAQAARAGEAVHELYHAGRRLVPPHRNAQAQALFAQLFGTPGEACEQVHTQFHAMAAPTSGLAVRW